jgi:murein DD-endopeptidase MepM/ murein hydrolase activator NlpD
VGTSPSRVVRAVLVILALGIAAPALAHPSATELRQEIEENQSRLEDAEQDLHSVTTEIVDAQADLQEIDRRLADAESKLAAVEADLREAMAEHAAAKEEVEKAIHDVAVATNRLHRVRGDLEQREGLLDARVAATYKYGTVTYAQAIVGSRDFTEFLQSFYYVRSALEFDGKLVDEILDLTRELAANRAEVARLRDVALDNEATAKAARDRVASLAAEQRAMTDEIAAERDRRASVLSRLQEERRRYEVMIAELDAADQQLQADLRAAIEEEARRRAAQGWTAGEAPGSGELAWPTDGRATSGFGYRRHPIFGTQRMHTGIDIPAPAGQPIVSAADGYVLSAGWRGGYGLAVVVDHGGSMATLYAHMSSISVSEGQVVVKGQHIGGVGTTGQSTGNHLHFEVRINGSPQDPMQWYR